MANVIITLFMFIAAVCFSVFRRGMRILSIDMRWYVKDLDSVKFSFRD
jgi:hypothetical protein